MAKDILARVARGERPASERTAKRREMTVGDLLDFVLEQHWRRKCKPTTVKEFERLIERDLKSEFGKIKIGDLNRGRIRQWHNSNDWRPRTANQSIAVLRKAFNFAISTDLLMANPVSHIEKHPEKRRLRVPDRAERRKIWTSMHEGHMHDAVRLCMKLLILTGARFSEIAHAQWSELDLEAQELRKIDTKTGPRVLFLPIVATALLQQTKRRGRWICPHPNDESQPVSHGIVHAAWREVLSDAGITDLRLHDLRHDFATRAARRGANAFALQSAMGHSDIRMSAQYIAGAGEAAKALVESVAAEFMAEVSEKATAGVISIRKG